MHMDEGCCFVVVSPDAIHEHVKTKTEGQEPKILHYAAPEFASDSGVRTSSDIYAFGICALEVSYKWNHNTSLQGSSLIS